MIARWRLPLARPPSYPSMEPRLPRLPREGDPLASILGECRDGGEGARRGRFRHIHPAHRHHVPWLYSYGIYVYGAIRILLAWIKYHGLVPRMQPRLLSRSLAESTFIMGAGINKYRPTWPPSPYRSICTKRAWMEAGPLPWERSLAGWQKSGSIRSGILHTGRSSVLDEDGDQAQEVNQPQ